MEENKNNNHYSTADIQKYMEGKLSAAEMHAIEKAALDDPFLADAIEGMQNNLQERSAELSNNDIAELNKRLKEKIQKKEKIIPIAPNRIWQRIAAAAIILIGSTALIYNYAIKDSEKNKTVALKKETSVTDSNIAKDNTTPAPLLNDNIDTNELALTEKKKPENLNEHKPKSNFIKQKAVDKKAAVQKKNIISSKESEPEKTVTADLAKDEEVKRRAVTTVKADTLNTDSSKNQIAANAQPAQALEGKVAGISVESYKKRADNHFVEGIVVDNNKNPVPGATVMLKNKKNGTSTDANGFFKLNVNTKDSITNVVVASLGFQSTEAKLNNNNPSSNLVQLQQSTNALSEVVVTALGISTDQDDHIVGYATKKKEKKIDYKAEPSVGWAAFNDYINQNKKIATADSTKKGKEIISFMVDTSNQLSSFKIKKSLSPAHDAESIRLLKQGPAWKLLKRKKSKITLAIEF